MAITNGYTTLPQLKEWLPVNAANADQDAKIENVVTSVSRWIDNYCQRHFWQVTEARVFDACDWRLLELGPFNDLAAAPTEVATDTDGNGTFDTVWATSDYQVLPLNATAAPETKPYRKIKAINRTWPVPAASGREGLIRVTGPWGWPGTPPGNIPADVYQGCLIQSSRIFRRKDAPEGTIGFAEFGVVRLQGRLDADVQALLAPYQRTAVLVA